MKTKNKISAYILYSRVLFVFFSLGFIAPSWAFNSVGATGSSDTTARMASQPRAFSFAERVAFQRTIEDVYWRHRIWPKENPDPKPSLDAVMSQAQLESKVENYLRESVALEEYGQKPITAEQLQAEMNRMAGDTKQPEVLRELFEALGNDPAVIAECLARPILTERLLAELTGQRQAAGVEPAQNETVHTMSVPTTLGRVAYTLPSIADACADDTWSATSTTHAPSGRDSHTAVWTGTEMIVWGGLGAGRPLSTGGRYNPSTDSWIHTSAANAPAARVGHAAVWTGSEMIVWGGADGRFVTLNTGGRYNPITNSWTATRVTNAPDHRWRHSAVWTGSEMIVWGGVNDYGSVYLNTGGRYNPNTNSWTTTSTTNAPDGRDSHTAVWTGSEMIVWGGYGEVAPYYVDYLNTGGRYNPSTNSWTATSNTNAPSARGAHAAVWTGTQMIVWGGAYYNVNGEDDYLNTGGRYDPITQSWTATSVINAPSARAFWGTFAIAMPSVVWTGSEMIVWAGTDNNTGGRYNPVIDAWTATTLSNVPDARSGDTAIWTGSEMVVWGGRGGLDYLNTGGRYCAPPASYDFKGDFNGDGHPDYLLYNASTQRTTVWYLNNNVYVNGRYGPTVPNGWTLVAVGDFNNDGQPDYVLYNAMTHRTLIWYMDDNVRVGYAQGPTLNAGWNLIGTADFNSDGHPDYLLFNPITRATAIYYMNNNVRVGSANGPTLNAGWSLVGTADFNSDGHPDYLLLNPTRHATLIYYMNNNVRVRWASGPTLNARWSLVGAADFNSDGHPDYLLFDLTTRDTLIYYMNNNVGLYWASGPSLNARWSIVAP